MSPTAQTMPLGIEGFTYADLYAPARLKELYDRFCRDVAAADPAFWAEWDAYRTAPDAPRSPVELVTGNAVIVSKPRTDGGGGREMARLTDAVSGEPLVAAPTPFGKR